MSPLNAAARLIATAVHEGIAEYRRLDAPEAECRPEMSCTAATTERAEAPAMETPIVAFGFGRPP